MKVKVIEIRAHAANGNDRTVHAIVSLGTTAAEVCEERNIPLLSVISVKETAPMKMKAAWKYVCTKQAELITPSTCLFKTQINIYAA